MSIVQFSTKPAPISLQSDATRNPQTISLEQLVKTHCPSLLSDFTPKWWLRNGHIQTLYGVLFGPSVAPKVWFKRQFLRLLDGGTIALDICPLDCSSFEDTTPIVVIIPGLAGGSHEPYIRSLVPPICDPTTKGGLGYRIIVVNHRGCAGVPLTTPKLYTAGSTDDFRQAIMYISFLYPQAPLLGLGFSLGANKLTRYLSEEGTNSKLKAAFILSNPWDMRGNGHLMRSNPIRDYIYGRGMGAGQVMLLKLHRKAFLSPFIDPLLSEAYLQALALKNPTLIEFDNAFTRYVGEPRPEVPYANVDEYYIWNSSHQPEILQRIKVPFCSLNAIDDPMVQHIPDVPDNPFIVMVATRHGGHLGWYRSAREQWVKKPVIEWLRVFGEEVLDSGNPGGRRLLMNKDGFITESTGILGCKPYDGGGLFSETTEWPWPHLMDGL
ncbi:AB-hydrolase YheT [Mycena floridula]|nr:AB-hydrolase YheT [Mycena floridula]